ncbi:MAG: hypothetical protein ISR99_02970 [Parcubacteria group bacterium]|nr:hypothetical protein [Parcubacteria group bacterium]
MKIVIASPLYPPDIAEPAPYVKELSKRLTESNEVTVVTYSHIPEKILGVKIVSTEKRRPLPFRLLTFALLLFKEAKSADTIYIENGASVELPAILVNAFLRRPLFIHIGDEQAHKNANKLAHLKFIESVAIKLSNKTIVGSPLKKPEILPFEEFPAKEFESYESSWKSHIEELHKIFEHAK